MSAARGSGARGSMTSSAAFLIVLAALGAQQSGASGRRCRRLQPPRQRLLAVEDARNPTAADVTFLVAPARENAGPDKATAATTGPGDPRVGAPRAAGSHSGPGRDARGSGDPRPGLAGLARHPSHARHPLAIRKSRRRRDALLARPTSPVVLRHLPLHETRTGRAGRNEAADAGEGSVAARSGRAPRSKSLRRRHRKLHPLGDASLDFLRKAVRRSLPRMVPIDDVTPRAAMAALAAAGHADEDIIEAGLRDRDAQVRRIATLALNSAGAAIEPGRRTDLTRSALTDVSAFGTVRSAPRVGASRSQDSRLRPDRRCAG